LALHHNMPFRFCFLDIALRTHRPQLPGEEQMGQAVQVTEVLS